MSYSTPLNNRLAEAITNKIREISARDSIVLLDMDSVGTALNTEIGLLQTYVHFTPKGCEFMSEKLAESVLDSRILQDD